VPEAGGVSYAVSYAARVVCSALQRLAFASPLPRLPELEPGDAHEAAIVAGEVAQPLIPHHGDNQRVVGQQAVLAAVRLAGVKVLDGEGEDVDTGLANVAGDRKVPGQAADEGGVLLEVLDCLTRLVDHHPVRHLRNHERRGEATDATLTNTTKEILTMGSKVPCCAGEQKIFVSIKTSVPSGS
jgi:hypothetical protein